MIRSLIFLGIASILLAGCTYKGPTRGFTYKDGSYAFSCSETPLEISVDPSKIPGFSVASVGEGETNGDRLKDYLILCQQFLNKDTIK